jgi:cephalosporin-C deacetylase-like acetyl esterase
MSNSSSSPATALAPSPLCATNTRSPNQRTAWNIVAAFLRRHRLGMLALVVAGMGLAGGGAWFGIAALLPLLYVLPCAAMMAMCMRGQGSSNAPTTTPDSGAGASDTGPSQ